LKATFCGETDNVVALRPGLVLVWVDCDDEVNKNKRGEERRKKGRTNRVVNTAWVYIDDLGLIMPERKK